MLKPDTGQIHHISNRLRLHATRPISIKNVKNRNVVADVYMESNNECNHDYISLK